MNKQETVVVVMLFVLLLGWGYLSGKAKTSVDAVPVEEQVKEPNQESVPKAGEVLAEALSKTNVTAKVEVAVSIEKEPANTVVLPGDEGHASESPEIYTLTSDEADVMVSSWGGSVTSVRLKKYQQTLDLVDDSLVLDFSSQPALALSGLPGLSSNNDFVVSIVGTNRSVVIKRTTSAGLDFKRTITLGADYLIKVRDVYVNSGTDPMVLPSHSISMGPMKMENTKTSTRGLSYLDVDTLPDSGGATVKRWSKEFNSMFGMQGGVMSCVNSAPTVLLDDVKGKVGVPVMWAAVKNKFFVQILSPLGEETASDCDVMAVRDLSSKRLSVATVSADLLFAKRILEPGASFDREMEYYVGPKKFAILSKLDKHRDKIMLHSWKRFGWFRSVCVLLLKTLNAIYMVIPNYGVAIILLTVIVRVLFWPITHKGTENMKKMQAIQPLVTELKEKYKDNPQKMQKATMALYKEHKVNPMLGCLPMLVQIPVFIALFTVLRSAVELRFADFLWIKDLSEPERLFEFGFALPIIGWDAFNILPLIMTGTMVLQQKLTPTSGDAQQQKMMAVMMPVMMLFLLYNMASALMLYWSVSQSLAILQLVMQRRKKT